jgi:protein-S-isoprenylcysteine O-methyltransferase Ste14
VTSGVYARVRHPQVAGLLLVAFGLSLAAGTLVGLLVAMVFLLWSLVQTRLEDRRLVALFGDEARRYITRVPAVLPRLGPRRHTAP